MRIFSNDDKNMCYPTHILLGMTSPLCLLSQKCTRKSYQKGFSKHFFFFPFPLGFSTRIALVVDRLARWNNRKGYLYAARWLKVCPTPTHVQQVARIDKHEYSFTVIQLFLLCWVSNFPSEILLLYNTIQINFSTFRVINIKKVINLLLNS